MNRFVRVIIGFILCVCFVIPITFASGMPENGVLIEYGSSAENITLQYDEYGPKSFAVHGDVLYILDSGSSTIKLYGLDGQYIKSFSFPSYLYAVDMEVSSNYFYIMCDNNYIYRADYTSSNPSWLIACSYSPHEIACLITNNGTVYARAFEGEDIILETAGEPSLSNSSQATLISNASSTACIKESEFEIKRNSTDYSIPIQGTPVGIYVLKDIGNTTYIMEQEALLSLSFVELRIGKYQGGNKIATAVPIQLTEYKKYIPFKKIYISDSGDVFQMITTDTGILIKMIPWENGNQTSITPAMLEENNQLEALSSELKPSTGVRVISTPSIALERAFAICNYQWSFNINTHLTPTVAGSTKSPTHLTASSTQLGIPYCSGGMNGVDCSFWSSAPYSAINFSTALANGRTAGNIEDVLEMDYSTAGIDCSGLVCQAYQISDKKSCEMLTWFFKKIDWSIAEPGDIGIRTNQPNYSDHAFIIVNIFRSSSGQVTTISTYESTRAGSAQKAKSYSQTYADILTGYSAYNQTGS